MSASVGKPSPSQSPHARTTSNALPIFPVEPLTAPKRHALPQQSDSALGQPLRCIASIATDTIRCYRVLKEDRMALLIPDDSVATPTGAEPASAGPSNTRFGSTSPSSPLSRGNETSFPISSSAGRTPSVGLWRVATVSDLLILAVCVLINIPVVARMLAASASDMTSSVDERGEALAVVGASATRLGLSAHGGHDDPVHGASSRMVGNDNEGFSIEALARMLAYVAVAAPQRVVELVGTIGIWVQVYAATPVHLMCAVLRVDDFALWSWLATVWRGTLVPALTSPAVFWTVLLLALVITRVFVHSRRVFIEEVVVVRGLGMQLTTRNYRGVVTRRKFLDINRIRSVFVHEAFFRQRVVFYLGVLLDNEADVTVLFEETLPRLALLRPLLCGIRSVLFEEPEDGATLGELEEAIGAS